MLTKSEIETLCLDLIAYCQREGILSTNDTTLAEELESITGGMLDADEIIEFVIG